jgi:hypothetical protein
VDRGGALSKIYRCRRDLSAAAISREAGFESATSGRRTGRRRTLHLHQTALGRSTVMRCGAGSNSNLCESSMTSRSQRCPCHIVGARCAVPWWRESGVGGSEGRSRTWVRPRSRGASNRCRKRRWPCDVNSYLGSRRYRPRPSAQPLRSRFSGTGPHRGALKICIMRSPRSTGSMRHNTERYRYELQSVGPGANAYVVKGTMRGSEPVHWVLCRLLPERQKTFSERKPLRPASCLSQVPRMRWQN